MKAKIKAIDLMFNKQVEVECSIRKDVDAAVELKRVTMQRDIRTRIVRGLQLSIGEASLELISYDRVIAEGTMRNNAFTGRAEITAKPCCRKAA
jgi:hypothetical protein